MTDRRLSDNAAPLGWCLGSTNPKKIIHRPGCVYSRQPYNWAGTMSADDLAAALISSGAVNWHAACGACAPDLKALLACTEEPT